MSDINSEIEKWVAKALTPNQVFAPKPMPVDLYSDNDAVRAAQLLEAKAAVLVGMHEARTFDGREPFTLDDYTAFAAAHKDIAEGHRLLGEELKANRPDALQAISAHGDAMAYHNDASKLAEMMQPSEDLGERNKMWPHMESNSFRFGRTAPWDTEEKQWRKAHQAFLTSQLAAQKTAFDTGVVEKGDVAGHAFHGNQYTGPFGGSAVSGLDPKVLQYEGKTVRMSMPTPSGEPHIIEGRIRTGMISVTPPRTGFFSPDTPPQEPQHIKVAYLQTKSSDYQNTKQPIYPSMKIDAVRVGSKWQNIQKATSEIQKGDTPGHPFHGNQWTTGQLAAANNEVRRLQNDAYNSDSLDGYDNIVDKHAQIADAHRALAAQARAEGRPSDAKVHERAAFRHDEAAEQNLFLHGSVFNDFGRAKQATDDAVNASLDALPLVKSVSEITKGDLPGHPFRGNQYTSLGEKASDLAKAVKKLNSRSTPDEIRSLAKVHEQVANQHFAVSRQSAEMRHLTDPSEVGQKTYDNLVSTSAVEGDKHLDAGYRHNDTADKLYYAAELKEQGSPSASSSVLANAKISSANAADASKEAASSGVHWPVGDPEFAQHEEAVALGKSAEIIQKGDVVGHVFHGNQYKGGTSSIPDNVGHRDFDPNTTLSQIGKMNILAVSGGKVHSIHDTDGKAIGVELPVSSGYKVRVFLRDDDTYTVQRVHRDNVKGEETGVFADQVGESVYQAGMYKSNPFGGHQPR